MGVPHEGDHHAGEVVRCVEACYVDQDRHVGVVPRVVGEALHVAVALHVEVGLRAVVAVLHAVVAVRYDAGVVPHEGVLDEVVLHVGADQEADLEGHY